MPSYLLDWANLLLRWTHVITAIAWIGSSFYFVFLDASLTKPADPDLVEKGVSGELWAVHGGGFYHPQKYLVSPKKLPEHLHWFFWESYSTWLSGFALFTVLYLFNASTFLVDKNVHDWSPGAAIAAALGFLASFWLFYDRICRIFGEKGGGRAGGEAKVGGDVTVGAIVLGFVTLAAWGACQLFAGRAAFLLMGAMLATAMSANVFFWIIPGQRKVVAQLRAGEPVSAIHGQRAKQRSVHNTYFTLPVLVAMLSNHYGWLYQGRWNWVVLVSMMLAGALIRHSFVARHKALVSGTRVPWEYATVGTGIVIAVVVALAPRGQVEAYTGPVPAFAQVKPIFDQRCTPCHNALVQNKGVALHDAANIAKNATNVYQQAVVLKIMPMNNATQITDVERGMLKSWFEAGAKTD
jgi:uncharacterized membrane protein